MNTLEICLSWKGDSSSFFSWVGTSLPTWAVAGLSENLGKKKAQFGDAAANTSSDKGQHVSGETCW